MVVPHVVIMISPKNASMQIHAEILMQSLSLFGNCKDFYASIVVPDCEKIYLNDYFLNNPNIELVSYVPTNSNQLPWSHSPRWFIEPKTELYLAIDSDALICKDLSSFLVDCVNSNALSAVQGLRSPFKKNAYETWEKIYNLAGLKLPSNLYMYRYFKQDIWASDTNDCVGPFYPNCGVIALPSKQLALMQSAVKEATKVVCEVEPNNNFIPQIVISLALSLSEISVNVLPPIYNSWENFDSFDDAVIYHYSTSRNAIKSKKDFKDISNVKLRKLFLEIVKISHL